MVHAKARALRQKEELMRNMAFMFKQYRVSMHCMKDKIEAMEKSNTEKQAQITERQENKYQNIINSKKIDSDTRRILMDQRKKAKSMESTLEHLWSEMTEKRLRLLEKQRERRREMTATAPGGDDSRHTRH